MFVAFADVPIFPRAHSTCSVKEVCLQAQEQGSVYDPSQEPSPSNINYRQLYEDLSIMQVSAWHPACVYMHAWRAIPSKEPAQDYVYGNMHIGMYSYEYV